MGRCISVHQLRAALMALCLFVGLGVASAAPLTVTGTVTQASDGEPMIGVSVLVKGTTTGTATDIDGNYSIKADEGQTLVFSYVGCKPQEIKVTSSRIDV